MLVDMRDLCHPHDEVCGVLMSMGAIVRDGNALGCPGWARVSVGTRDEIDFFLAKLDALDPACAGSAAGRREVELSMMIIMHEGATEEQIAHVVARIEEVGASAHVSTGDRVTVIGAIGDREDLTSLPLEACAGRRPRGRHPQALQARQPRVPPGRHGHRRARQEDRRRPLRDHRRPVLGRDRRAGDGRRRAP